MTSKIVSSVWLSLRRQWRATDEVKLNFPMDIERVTMPSHFKEYRNLVALQRGPIVYCLEAQDIDSRSASETEWDRLGAYLPEDPPITPEHRPDFLGGVTVLHGMIRPIKDKNEDGPLIPVMFIPYGVWNNRTPGAMRVWFGSRKVPLYDFSVPSGNPETASDL